MNNDSKFIIALDFPAIQPLRDFVQQLQPNQCRLKIGNILFTRYGPALIEELMQVGFEIFLDLKFHDIPATVAGACCSAAELGVWMVNVHVAAGTKALLSAREALQKYSKPPLLIGVTVLTSLQEKDLLEVGMNQSTQSLVLQRAQLAKQIGLDGVVCSAQEAKVLRAELGHDFLLVTPGIRLTKDEKDDQQRIMTPEAALRAGASYLVIGRSITNSANPAATVDKLSRISTS